MDHNPRPGPPPGVRIHWDRRVSVDAESVTFEATSSTNQYPTNIVAKVFYRKQSLSLSAQHCCSCPGATLPILYQGVVPASLSALRNLKGYQRSIPRYEYHPYVLVPRVQGSLETHPALDPSCINPTNPDTYIAALDLCLNVVRPLSWLHQSGYVHGRVSASTVVRVLPADLLADDHKGISLARHPAGPVWLLGEMTPCPTLIPIERPPNADPEWVTDASEALDVRHAVQTLLSVMCGGGSWKAALVSLAPSPLRSQIKHWLRTPPVAADALAYLNREWEAAWQAAASSGVIDMGAVKGASRGSFGSGVSGSTLQSEDTPHAEGEAEGDGDSVSEFHLSDALVTSSSSSEGEAGGEAPPHRGASVPDRDTRGPSPLQRDSSNLASLYRKLGGGREKSLASIRRLSVDAYARRQDEREMEAQRSRAMFGASESSSEGESAQSESDDSTGSSVGTLPYTDGVSGISPGHRDQLLSLGVGQGSSEDRDCHTEEESVSAHQSEHGMSHGERETEGGFESVPADVSPRPQLNILDLVVDMSVDTASPKVARAKRERERRRAEMLKREREREERERQKQMEEERSPPTPPDVPPFGQSADSSETEPLSSQGGEDIGSDPMGEGEGEEEQPDSGQSPQRLPMCMMNGPRDMSDDEPPSYCPPVPSRYMVDMGEGGAPSSSDRPPDRGPSVPVDLVDMTHTIDGESESDGVTRVHSVSVLESMSQGGRGVSSPCAECLKPGTPLGAEGVGLSLSPSVSTPGAPHDSTADTPSAPSGQMLLVPDRGNAHTDQVYHIHPDDTESRGMGPRCCSVAHGLDDGSGQGAGAQRDRGQISVYGDVPLWASPSSEGAPARASLDGGVGPERYVSWEVTVVRLDRAQTFGVGVGMRDRLAKGDQSSITSSFLYLHSPSIPPGPTDNAYIADVRFARQDRLTLLFDRLFNQLSVTHNQREVGVVYSVAGAGAVGPGHVLVPYFLLNGAEVEVSPAVMHDEPPTLPHPRTWGFHHSGSHVQTMDRRATLIGPRDSVALAPGSVSLTQSEGCDTHVWRVLVAEVEAGCRPVLEVGLAQVPHGTVDDTLSLHLHLSHGSTRSVPLYTFSPKRMQCRTLRVSQRQTLPKVKAGSVLSLVYTPAQSLFKCRVNRGMYRTMHCEGGLSPDGPVVPVFAAKGVRLTLLGEDTPVGKGCMCCC
ncbi:hypothetical protein KIPB_004285 [Kipferlia bialata]|uniref:Uncharacterized protein n=1 Tax=Kipferlia bialata TaxID=797122 RepID=A0A9K3GHC4_9EUKA|nr:hypothetical protein KIPB_004285 [Kipferlia bialata]|eukprot:g4285.t1